MGRKLKPPKPVPEGGLERMTQVLRLLRREEDLGSVADGTNRGTCGGSRCFELQNCLVRKEGNRLGSHSEQHEERLHHCQVQRTQPTEGETATT